MRGRIKKQKDVNI